MVIKIKYLFFIFAINQEFQDLYSKPNTTILQERTAMRDISSRQIKINDYMSDTSTTLQRLENTLQSFCKPIADKLQKGLPSDYINDILHKSNIKNETIEKLYKWKNGITIDTGKFVGEFDLSSQGKMLPLEEAIAHYERCTKQNLWKERYFPLFASNAGDYLLYDVDRNSKTYGMLLLYSPSLLIVEPEPIYDSLESFLETVIVCYEQGVYKFDNNSNTLEIDDDMEFEISAKLNTKSAYWRN